MDASTVKNKWKNRELTKEDLLKYINGAYKFAIENIFKLTSKEVKHVANTIYEVYRADCGETASSFAKALINNELLRAVASADPVNLKALGLTPIVLYNIRPEQ